VLALRGTGLGFVMITVALGQIVWGVAYRWVSLPNGDNGISITGRPSPFGLSLASPRSFYWATLVVFLAAILAMVVFVASPFGASVRGTRDQPRRMNALGYHVWMIRFAAFLFSGFWSGVAGLLYLYYHQFVSPQAVALTASAEALLMVISGGTGTLLGPIVGAALVVVIKNVASAYIESWNFVLGAIFVVIVVFMPEGLVPGVARVARRVRVVFRPDTRVAMLRNVTLALLGRTRLRWNPFVRLDRQTRLIDRARDVLARVGLDHLAERPLAQTAYGERRRVEIAMALAQSPRVLLLDEPFAGLSIEERRDVLTLVTGIPRDVTVAMLEHDMDL